MARLRSQDLRDLFVDGDPEEPGHPRREDGGRDDGKSGVELVFATSAKDEELAQLDSIRAEVAREEF
jgi:hypothetical protein